MAYIVAAGGSEKHNTDGCKIQGRRPRPGRRDVAAPILTYYEIRRKIAEAVQRAEEDGATG